MCGIVGLASVRPHDDPAWLPAALEAMAHRGPDAQGQWRSSDGHVTLGHRRLAIVDLSPDAGQPMSRGELTLTFNGEIYNFQDLRAQLRAEGFTFTTESDTEVVLAAYQRWGEQCLAHLQGMFAFALHDRRAGGPGRVLLARDRAGEKPLFYRFSRGELRFASELKALLCDQSLPRRLDRKALDAYLGLGFVPGAMCILEGFAKLPAAHAMSADLQTGQLRVWRYWQLPPGPVEPAPARPEVELVDELESLLADAVRRQLVADVPLGVTLSGGVDSSLVTALAARCTSRLRTFTVSFPGTGRFDEGAHARLIADHFGTDHTEIEAEAASVELLPTLAHQFDEPLIDSSMLPTYLVSRQIRRHCSVAVGGDGGDELFGGYSHYDRLLRLQSHAALLPRPLRRAASAVAARLLPAGTRGRNWVLAAAADFEHEVPLVASYFDRPQRASLLGPAAAKNDEAMALWRQASTGEGDLLQRATRADFGCYLTEDILVKVDRASMLSSLEVRAPFLDHRVIEFAFGRVPSSAKATPHARKLLLKQLAKRLLPAGFDLRRKQGFSIPIADWLARPDWDRFFRSTLLDGPDPLFDRQAVRALFKEQARGRVHGERLFGLLMFELWRRHYGVTV